MPLYSTPTKTAEKSVGAGVNSRYGLIAGGAGLLLAAVAATTLIPPRADAEAEIGRLTAELESRQAEVDELKTTLAVRDQVLESLNATVAERDAALDALEDRLAEATDEIEALKAQLDSRMAQAPDAGAETPTLADARTPPVLAEPKLAIFAPDPAPIALAAVPADPADLDRIFAAKAPPAALALPLATAEDIAASVRVQFDFASARLSPGGQIFAAAAAVALSDQQLERIRVVGHTDRVGSPAANRRLAERRARTVADFLIASGIPADLIEIDGMGETDAPVATDDGVAEPLNRSVAIVPVPIPLS
jgi:outer membrane protein OmpA-like peptidoglycan-associated protein